jgi:DnaK suppressor protein
MPTKTTDKTPTPKASRKAAEVDAPTTDNAAVADVNAASTGTKPQQRQDIDVDHYRQLLLEEMARLEEEREYLRKTNSDMDGNLPEDAESDEDTADLASSLMDKEMDLSVEEEIDDTMSAIEHALRKMEDGTYGICDVSGQPIPKSRLELIPWASLTAQMQAVAEGD